MAFPKDYLLFFSDFSHLTSNPKGSRKYSYFKRYWGSLGFLHSPDVEASGAETLSLHITFPAHGTKRSGPRAGLPGGHSQAPWTLELEEPDLRMVQCNPPRSCVTTPFRHKSVSSLGHAHTNQGTAFCWLSVQPQALHVCCVTAPGCLHFTNAKQTVLLFLLRKWRKKRNEVSIAVSYHRHNPVKRSSRSESTSCCLTAGKRWVSAEYDSVWSLKHMPIWKHPKGMHSSK